MVPVQLQEARRACPQESIALHEAGQQKVVGIELRGQTQLVAQVAAQKVFPDTVQLGKSFFREHVHGGYESGVLRKSKFVLH